MSAALKEWKSLAAVYGVKPCELRFAMAMIDSAFKGTMTDYQLAFDASQDPVHVTNIRQMILEENIDCVDEQPEASKWAKSVAKANFLRGVVGPLAVNKQAIGIGLQGAFEKDPVTGEMVYNRTAKTIKSLAWKTAEKYLAKKASAAQQATIIDAARKRTQKKMPGSLSSSLGDRDSWMMFAQVVAVPALVLYLLFRKKG
jgi:hypothetical protein